MRLIISLQPDRVPWIIPFAYSHALTFARLCAPLRRMRVLDMGRHGCISFVRFELLYCHPIPYNAFARLDWLQPLLAQIYHITGPQFGRLADVLDGRGYPTWLDYLLSRLNHYTAVIKRDKNAIQLQPALHTMRACLCGPFDTSAHLTHHDLKPENIYRLLPDERAILLDWEGAIFGDPLYDLAKLWWRSKQPAGELFLDLYEGILDAPVSRSVAAFRLQYYRALNALGAYIASVGSTNHRYDSLRQLAWSELCSTNWAQMLNKAECLASKGDSTWEDGAIRNRCESL